MFPRCGERKSIFVSWQGSYPVACDLDRGHPGSHMAFDRLGRRHSWAPKEPDKIVLPEFKPWDPVAEPLDIHEWLAIVRQECPSLDDSVSLSWLLEAYEAGEDPGLVGETLQERLAEQRMSAGV